MPLYEFRCKTCDERFEERRSMADADAPATCPASHGDAVRLLAVFASTGRAGSGTGTATAAPVRTGGGCGGHCACH